jgi:hypothetical protein
VIKGLSSSDKVDDEELSQIAKHYLKGEKAGPTAEDREKYPILSMLEQLDN